MRRVLPVVATVVVAGVVVGGSLYVGRSTSSGAADVVTQPAASAGSSASKAETQACVIGLGLALDAGPMWDSNTAIEDAYELKALLDRLSDKGIRAAAGGLARQVPQLVEASYDDFVQGQGDSASETTDPTDQIAELLGDLRDACDNRFL
jgi:hypothetical protein